MLLTCYMHSVQSTNRTNVLHIIMIICIKDFAHSLVNQMIKAVQNVRTGTSESLSKAYQHYYLII